MRLGLTCQQSTADCLIDTKQVAIATVFTWFGVMLDLSRDFESSAQFWVLSVSSCFLIGQAAIYSDQVDFNFFTEAFIYKIEINPNNVWGRRAMPVARRSPTYSSCTI